MKLEERKISKTAVVVTFLYLLTVVASLIIMLMTKDDTPMSGIFLIMVTMPWAWYYRGFKKFFILIQHLVSGSWRVAEQCYLIQINLTANGLV